MKVFWDVFWAVLGLGFGVSIGLVMVNIALLTIQNIDGLFYKFLWIVKRKKTNCPHCYKEITWTESL
jgi:hypothetical protein